MCTSRRRPRWCAGWGYSVERIFLDQAIEGLISAAEERLLAHRNQANAAALLKDVALVVRGDRMVEALSFPLVGVTAGVATPIEQTTYSVRWEVPIRLTVQVVDHRPNVAFPQARQIAARAFHAMFTNPASGSLEWDLPGVSPETRYALRAGNYEPPAGSSQEEDLFQARSAVIATVKTTY